MHGHSEFRVLQEAVKLLPQYNAVADTVVSLRYLISRKLLSGTEPTGDRSNQMACPEMFRRRARGLDKQACRYQLLIGETQDWAESS